MWRVAVLCLLVLGLMGIQSFELVPLSSVLCPERDEMSKTYYVLERYNTTCFNVSFDRCHTNVDTDKDSSSEDDDDHDSKHHDHDHHHHHGHHHEQQPHWITGLCWDIVSANCTKFHCVKKCFDGWAMDELKQCTKYVGSDKQPCRNGGTLYSDGACTCPDGFNGQYCELLDCEKPCGNGGICAASMYGGNYCACPPPFYGPQCLQMKCPEDCQNGGQCIVDGPKAICLCKPGYNGKTCANQIQNECPPPYFTGDCTCHDTCIENRDCDVEQRCCSDGCCNQCAQVWPFLCHHEGASYPVGQVFSTEKCTYCMCNWNATVTCSPITCPDVSCPYGEQIHTYDQCCPTCSGELPPGYTKPVFENDVDFGEGEIVHVSLGDGDDFQMKKLGVKARDYNNTYIPVQYQPKIVRHCLCPLSHRSPIPMVLFAKDSFGQTTERHVSIFLTDNDPPQFERCPADIYALSSETVYWHQPIPVDNVGINKRHVNYRYIPLDENCDPNDVDFDESARKYPIGNFTVTYTASDFDYNMATCEFSVYVFDENTDYSRLPPELAARKKESSNAAGIVGGCVAGIIALIVIITLAVAVHKKRQINQRRPRAGAHVATRQGQSNAQSVSVTNPEYQGSSAAAPPPYPWPSAPPTYDEVKDMAKDDPPKYEEIGADGKTKTEEENVYESMGNVGCPQDTRARY